MMALGEAKYYPGSGYSASKPKANDGMQKFQANNAKGFQDPTLIPGYKEPISICQPGHPKNIPGCKAMGPGKPGGCKGHGECLRSHYCGAMGCAKCKGKKGCQLSVDGKCPC